MSEADAQYFRRRAREEREGQKENRGKPYSGGPHSNDYLADAGPEVNHFPLTWSFKDTRSFSMSRMSGRSISNWRSSPIVLFF